MIERMNFNIEVFKSREMDTNCYLIITEKGNLVIDPCVEYKKIEKYGKVDAVLLTHGHFDHFDKIDSYFNNNITFCMHRKCLEKIKYPDKNMSEQFGKPISFDLRNEKVVELTNRDRIEIHNLYIAVMMTRGHTDCSITYILDDIMFTGDFLFKGSIGRTDFYSSNMSRMLNSIDLLLRTFKNDYVILPGHGEETTLKEEKRTNYFLMKYGNGGENEFMQF